MERDAQIRQTAAEWLRYNHPTCTQDMLVEAFRCGAEWADRNQWRLSVDVGTPPPGSSWVLGAYENGDIRIVRYSYACFTWLYIDNEEAPNPVYWMPIPQVPDNN